MRHSAAHSTQVTTAAMVSEIVEEIARHAPERLDQRRLVEGELDRRVRPIAARSAQLHDRPGARGEQGVEGRRDALGDRKCRPSRSARRLSRLGAGQDELAAPVEV